MRDIGRQVEELFCAAAEMRCCTAQVVADGAVREFGQRSVLQVRQTRPLGAGQE
ncbi:Uncharacterised protein [Nocardia africana]|uniref:Uncharacterized protein n=1 Tax=Nocardia africana TaxID=134964 RepID=A0A378WVV6_9NOCA|nr:Uncharacterised protein [Nocardia africana]